MQTFRDLRAWQKSIDLVELIYRFSDSFPARERFGLTAQIRSAAVSIPSNIAEGQGRITNGECLQFLGHARGSLYELETHLMIVERLGYGRADSQASACVDDVGSTLAGLMTYVQRKANRRRA